MNNYQVVQSFFSSRLGVEGKLHEYLEMSLEDAQILGPRYIKGVSRDAMRALQERRIKPRIVVITDKVKRKLNPPPPVTKKEKQVDNAADKMIKPKRSRTRNK